MVFQEIVDSVRSLSIKEQDRLIFFNNLRIENWFANEDS
jgi:hypothetical protein